MLVLEYELPYPIYTEPLSEYQSLARGRRRKMPRKDEGEKIFLQIELCG